jgi:hypothetical protein
MPVVRAVGVAVGKQTDPSLAQRIQEAMMKAIEAAHAEGITDDKEIHKRMMAAREQAIQE